MHPPDYLNGSTYLYSNMMITGGDRPKNLNESRGSPMVASSAVVQDGPMLFDLSESARPGLLKAASERGKTKTGKRGPPGGGPAPRRHGWSSVPLNRAFFKLDQGGGGERERSADQAPAASCVCVPVMIHYLEM